jgi:hypothetical protein
MTNTFDVERAFRGRQDVLLATLTSGRDVISHAPTKGTSAELKWVDMLREFLPNRYAVDSAFVVDANGQVSDQIDLVIYDCQYSPLLFLDEAGLYIAAESVYAAFEVKQTLSREHIDYAGEKVASVRSLDRTSAEIRHAGGTYAPKQQHYVLGGLLTLSTEWTPCMGEPFDGAIRGASVDQRLDLGCALSCGAFEVVAPEDDLVIDRCDSEFALMFFVLRLFRRLQRIGTVPAIDISRYGRTIWNGEDKAERRPSGAE